MIATLSAPASRSSRRRLSRGAAIGIGVSIALHAGAVAYLAIARFVLKPPEATAEKPRPPVTWLDLPRPEPKPQAEPPPPTSQPPLIKARPSLQPPIGLDPPPAPFEPLEGPVVDDPGPPTLTQEPVLPPAPNVELIQGPPVIEHPDWLRRPTGEDLARHYPRRALEQELSGRAQIACSVTAAGRLQSCVVVSETPAGRGFGDAALKLSRAFQMRPQTEDGRPVEGGRVNIPITFEVK
jgi:protein TonB